MLYAVIHIEHLPLPSEVLLYTTFEPCVRIQYTFVASLDVVADGDLVPALPEAVLHQLLMHSRIGLPVVYHF